MKSHTFFVMKRRLLPSSESLKNVFSFRKFVKNTHFPVCWLPCKVETFYGIGRSHLLSQNKILFHQHILQIPQTHEDNGGKYGLALPEAGGDTRSLDRGLPNLELEATKKARTESQHFTERAGGTFYHP